MLRMPESISIPIRNLGDEPAGRPGEPAAGAAAEHSAEGSIAAALAEVAIELVVLATGVIVDVTQREDDAAAETSDRVLHAGAGFLIEAIRAVGDGAASLERTATDSANANTVTRNLIDHWEAIWHQRKGAGDSGSDQLNATVDAVLDRLDLTGLVRRHLDLNAVVDDLDLDPIMARVDMDALIARMDIDELTARIDMDALTARIDIAALVERIDLTALAAAVIDDLDIAELIRQASAETTSEEIGRLRLRSVEADGAVQRAMDVVLRRKGER